MLQESGFGIISVEILFFVCSKAVTQCFASLTSGFESLNSNILSMKRYVGVYHGGQIFSNKTGHVTICYNFDSKN